MKLIKWCFKHQWTDWIYHRYQGEAWEERRCTRCGKIEQRHIEG